MDWKNLISVGSFDVARVLELLDKAHTHDETVTSVSVKFKGELLAKGAGAAARLRPVRRQILDDAVVANRSTFDGEH